MINDKEKTMETINKKAIADLADLLHEHKLTEIEYESGDTRIRVSSKAEAAAVPEAAPVAAPVTTPVVAAEKPAVPANTVKSPMVGVVYLSADPNSAPFVSVGDLVGAGQTLCLIEAMKTFNPVKAEKSGKIVQILVESGTPVEFNEPLFVLE